VCRYAARRRREGVPWAVIARETALDARKLQRWRSRAQRSVPVPVLRPVEVVPKPDVVPDVSPHRDLLVRNCYNLDAAFDGTSCRTRLPPPQRSRFSSVGG
jgi:hypothetical protein